MADISHLPVGRHQRTVEGIEVLRVSERSTIYINHIEDRAIASYDGDDVVREVKSAHDAGAFSDKEQHMVHRWLQLATAQGDRYHTYRTGEKY